MAVEPKERKHRPGFVPNISFAPGPDMDSLRRLAKSEPAAFVAKIKAEVDGGRFGWDQVRSLPRLYDLLADVAVPTVVTLPSGTQRAIMASAFPVTAGLLTLAGINAAYETYPSIGQELVQDFRDPQDVTVYATLEGMDVAEDYVPESQEFPEIKATDSKVTINAGRNGRRLSITAEMIAKNQIPQIVERVNRLGEIAAESVEVVTIKRVIDLNGSAASPTEPYAYRPNGTGIALFQTDNDPMTRLSSSGNRYTSNALVDETDLSNVRARFATHTNDLGYKLSLPWSGASGFVLLVPDATLEAASKILMSELTPGVENEYSMWGPRGNWRPRLLSSPKLDAYGTAHWYMGWPQRQFRRKWSLDYEYVTLGTDTESFLKSRIAFQARIAWGVEVGAIDYVYWIQSLNVTTPPA